MLSEEVSPARFLAESVSSITGQSPEACFMAKSLSKCLNNLEEMFKII